MCVAGAFRAARSPSRRVAAAATGFAVLGLAASFTGYLLPWDQLALWAVTIGAKLPGGLWGAAFSDQVRFVLMRNREISQSELRTWFLVHAFVLPPLIAATLFAAFFRRARTRAS
jgi:quinol-cytochrome oxidoreductase complex cytochrome b subunit